MERQSNRSDVRLIDLERGTNLRLTTSPATDASPIWSSDGSRIVFRSNRDLLHDLYIRQTAGGGTDELLITSSASKYPTDWTPDGRSVVYHAFNERTHYDVWAASLDHPNQPRPLVQTDFVDVQGRISPSGRWVAYTSNLSSRFEVYVQALHADGRKWQVSTGGGSDPRWRADERELYYVSSDGQMMSVALTGGTSFDPGAPRPLFRLGDAAIIRRGERPAPPLGPYLSAYDVQRDGQRFLVRAATQELQTHPINVLVNWSVPEHSAR